MKDNTDIKKGDIFYVNLGKEKNGHIQNGGHGGVRPCIIVNNNVACLYSPVLLVVPISSSAARVMRKFPTHLVLEGTLKKKSVALFEQILTVNRSQLRGKIATLPDNLMQSADEMLKVAFGLPRTA